MKHTWKYIAGIGVLSGAAWFLTMHQPGPTLADETYPAPERQGVYQLRPAELECDRYDCDGYIAHSFDRKAVLVTDVDTEGFDRQTAEDILAGKLLVHGQFVAYDPADLDRDDHQPNDLIFEVSEVAGRREQIHRPMDSGIRCVTAPCPTVIAFQIEGQHTLYTQINMEALDLGKEEEMIVRRQMVDGQWIVQGHPGRWEPNDGGPYEIERPFFVTGLVDGADAVGSQNPDPVM
jgi:hypothetical protein